MKEGWHGYLHRGEWEEVLMGRNMKRLIACRMSVDAIPDGGGMVDGVKFLLNPAAVKLLAKQSTEWVKQAIAAVKSTPDNPYGDDDEAIAGVILERIERKRNESRCGQC